MLTLGQGADGPEAVGIKTEVIEGQSSATHQQCDQGKSPDLSKSQVPQCNLRVIIVPISLRVVQMIKRVCPHKDLEHCVTQDK